MTKPFAACLAAVVIALAACGSSSSKAQPPPKTAAPVAALGAGVTATEIHVGIALVDFECIKQFVDGLRLDQVKVYQAFIDDVNEHGGVDGRQIKPTFKVYCPIQNAPALAACTSLTEDSNVFAVIGTFVDFSGDAQKCITNRHHRVLESHVVSQQIIDGSPPGLLITPDVTPERRAAITLALVKREKTLDGKKVGILGEAVTQARVHKDIEPEIKALGVETGTTAILNITGSDTSAAQSQLDAFIEKWKSEGVNALFMSGDQVTHTQFIQKVRAAMPGILLVSDTDAFGGFGQDAKQAGVDPNPYEGALTAEGPPGPEHEKGANWKQCSAIYEAHFHKHAPTANEVILLLGGKKDATHDAINDACTDMTLFAAIARKAGPNLNNDTWVATVNSIGSVPVMDATYGSLHTGKYDANDTYGLAAFDSSIGPKGDWRSVTPVVDVGTNP